MGNPLRPTGMQRRALARPPASDRTERLGRLHATAAALSAALGTRDVAAAIAARLAAAFPRSSRYLVGYLSEDGAELAVVASRGGGPELEWPLACLHLSADLPLATAARERRTVLEPGLAALPLLAGERVLGAIQIGVDDPDREERSFLETFAALCAQALDRARMYEAERAARLEARRATEAARSAVELQERLVGVVGHDLRTPLAAVHMATTLLSRHGPLSEDQARTLGRIGASVARMTALIRDLLDFTRVRNEGRIPLTRRPTDLAEAARRAVAELQGIHLGRDLLLDAPLPAMVDGDPERLAQMVSNLAGNAVQHAPPGAPVRVTVRAAEGGVELAVHNGGPPIPEDILPEVFEPFRRGVRGPDPSGSIGLGLFIVREIVRGHGGEVDVRSSAEHGTTFTVRLRPARVAAPV